tara:strand:- start:1651 stop:1758 length:108 start_codon:yes stop_codon:yes gene_type:complete
MIWGRAAAKQGHIAAKIVLRAELAKKLFASKGRKG